MEMERNNQIDISINESNHWILYLLLEIWTIIVGIQIWWVNQIYILTSIVLIIVLITAILIPVLLINKEIYYKKHLRIDVISLTIPSVFAFLLVFLSTIGIKELFRRYIYDSIVLDVLAVISFIGIIVIKTHFYLAQRIDKKPKILLFLILDIVFCVGFIVFLMNIEGIIRILRI